MPFNTGNAVPSNAGEDLDDNSRFFDKFATGSDAAATDRLGASRKTVSGMESEFASSQSDRAAAFGTEQSQRESDFNAFIASRGYEFIGDYAAGIEVTEYNQVIREAGEFWRASVDTALPYTTTGAGMPENGAFVNIGDAILRQELAGDPADGLGAALVKGTVIRVESVAAMEAYSAPVGYVFSLNSGGRSGTFDVIAGDFSTELSADTESGIFIAQADDPTAVNKVAKRRDFETFDVEWFGFIPGATDDSSVLINKIADFVSAIFGGGTIMVPACSNKATGVKLKNNIKLKGAGSALTLFTAFSTTSSEHIISNDDQTNGNENLAIEGMTLDDDRTDGNTVGSNCVYFNKVTKFLMEDLIIMNPQSYGSEFARCRDGLVNNCHAKITNVYSAAPDDGFSVSDTGYTLDADRSSNIVFSYCTAEGFIMNLRQSGFEIDDGPQNIKFVACHSENNNIGFTAHSHANEMSVNNIRYIGCTAKDVNSGFLSHPRSSAPISFLSYVGCHVNGAADDCWTFDDQGGDLQNVSLVGCTGEDSPTGVLHEYAGSISFSGCNMTETTTSWNIKANSSKKIFSVCAPSEIARFQWIPVVADAGGTQASITVNDAGYHLDGVYCYLHLNMVIDSVSGLTAGDSLEISGLPFRGNHSVDRLAFNLFGLYIATANGNQFGYYQRLISTDVISLGSMSAAGSATYATFADVSAGARVIFAFRYRV